MKQLKIIVDNINPRTGYITANFNQTIDINPFSSIALDKISMQIAPNASGTLQIQTDQTIYLVTQNQGSKPTARRAIVLPAGTYNYNVTGAFNPDASQGNPDFIETLNNLFNGSLSGAPNAPTTSTIDWGLGFKWIGALSGTGATQVYKVRLDCYQVEFAPGQAGTVPITQLANMSQSGNMLPASSNVSDNNFGLTPPSYTTPAEYWAINNNQILQGAYQGWIRLVLGNIDTSNSFKWGLCKPTAPNTKPLILYGIVAEDDEVYYLNNGIKGEAIGKARFTGAGTTNIYLFTDSTSGNLRFAIENPSGTYFVSEPATYSGYNFNTPYFLAVSGYKTAVNGNITYFTNWHSFSQPNLTEDNLGTYYEVPDPKIYVTSNNNLLGATTPSRQIQVNFTNSPLLINNLGFGLNILQGNVSSTSTFSVTASNGIDFANWYDLALDCLNLSLETYVAKTNGKDCGKKNTIAYFVMQRISDADALFYAEQKQMVFLSIENKEPISISSMSFRIYDINTLQPVNLTSGSFNLYVADSSDDGGHSRVFPKGSKRLGHEPHEIAQF